MSEMAASELAVPERATLEKRTIEYNDSVSRFFVFASVGWGIVGMLVGALAALQMAWWPANVDPHLAFGRIRPLHTNAVIFAFVGNMAFAGIYYSTQRLVKARLASDMLSKFHFWGWQAIIVGAAITLPLGFTQGKEYAELEWPLDLAIAIVWVAFAINFFWTLAKRTEKHIYVAIWFYIATIVTVAVLHIVNSLAIPVFGLKSYSIFGGAKDALVQWWYGHNAVAFFLTTPILGIMYYFLPKAAGRPVYSYRLSIIHFWALIFVYIWAGPHHLLNTALPEWAQTLGMIFSVMLWAPSWGGMLNGLLTLRGGWQQLRTDPVLKFFAAALTFYGMATFEGPLLSIKSVSGLAHYTDWIVGHVHAGALGWNGLMAAGMFYWMIPRLYGTKLYSTRAANFHFYLGTFGILLYITAMWTSGVTQGLMWRASTADGALQYPNFIETVNAIRPMYWMRLIGGTAYLVGMIIMLWNLIATARAGKPVNGTADVVVAVEEKTEEPWTSIVFGKPVVLVVTVGVFGGVFLVTNLFASVFFALTAAMVGVLGTLAITASQAKPHAWHRLLEGRALLFTVLTVIAVLVGGIAEIVPSLLAAPDKAAMADQKPYRPLELEGRDVYLREGCYNCHSQMIRPFRFEQARYGEPSTMSESQFDHPFQWGSKRTGPDLAREGGKYPNLWHVKHLEDPRSITPGSNMPPYAALENWKVDYDRTAAKVAAMKSIGVPYTDADVKTAANDARDQAADVAKDLKEAGSEIPADSDMVALIAYLQRLGVASPPPKPGVNVSLAPKPEQNLPANAQ
jgi:cytochrome c oxidase cbb3-type subunit I/II